MTSYCLQLRSGEILNEQYLVDSANRKRRDGCIHSIWTVDGKRFVKTSPKGNPVKIFTKHDLEYH